MLPGAAQDTRDPTSANNTAIATSVLLYSNWETSNLIATTGETPYKNRLTTYVGSADDTALNTGVERIKPDGRGRIMGNVFNRRLAKLRPLMTVHNTLDECELA